MGDRTGIQRFNLQLPLQLPAVEITAAPHAAPPQHLPAGGQGCGRTILAGGGGDSTRVGCSSPSGRTRLPVRPSAPPAAAPPAPTPPVHPAGESVTVPALSVALHGRCTPPAGGRASTSRTIPASSRPRRCRRGGGRGLTFVARPARARLQRRPVCDSGTSATCSGVPTATRFSAGLSALRARSMTSPRS